MGQQETLERLNRKYESLRKGFQEVRYPPHPAPGPQKRCVPSGASFKPWALGLQQAAWLVDDRAAKQG